MPAHGECGLARGGNVLACVRAAWIAQGESKFG
jgi:hypothetical protein